MAGSRNETNWQQGFILKAATASELGLARPQHPEDTVVMLISHDCDLVESSEIEPSCEILIGRAIDQVDGTYTNGKNSRKLHLTFTAGELQISAEFLATDKRAFDKGALLQQEPAEKIRLSTTEHFTLQGWLASRYYRPIFPDAFDARLKAKPAEVHKRIAKIIAKTGSDLVAVLFDVDQGQNVERGEGDPYSLGIYLIYSVSEDPGRAEKAAKDAANSIKTLLRQYYFKSGKWEGIELRECLPISEDVLTLFHFRNLKPWEFDYVEIVTRNP
jgi:hypothetical protein